MMKITFNKLVDSATCMFCHTNKVPLKDWNKRCSDCKKLQQTKDEEEQRVNVKSRQPAAIITTEGGEKIFVDKFGKEVKNPGYDLQNDARGFKYTGTAPKQRTFIK